MRTRGYQNGIRVVGLGAPLRRGCHHAARPVESSRPLDNQHAVLLQVLLYVARLGRRKRSHPVVDDIQCHIDLTREPDTERAGVEHLVHDIGDSDEGLARHAVRENRRTTQAVGVDQDNLGSELDCDQRSLVSAWSPADYHHARHAVILAYASPALPAITPTLAVMALYAAYGSNMDPRQMAERAPHSPMAGSGWLDGWRLTFGGEDLGWEGSLATVVEDPGCHVFVVLYDLTSLDEHSLDAWEGALGIYDKIRLRVETLDGDRLAWLYVVNGYEGGLPSARYLGIMADAAEAAGAPDDYVRDLRTRPCRSVGP